MRAIDEDPLEEESARQVCTEAQLSGVCSFIYYAGFVSLRV
jgi:hypothetical protein